MCLQLLPILKFYVYVVVVLPFGHFLSDDTQVESRFWSLTLRATWLFRRCSERSDGEEIGTATYFLQCTSSGALGFYSPFLLHIMFVHIHNRCFSRSPNHVDLLIFFFYPHCLTYWRSCNGKDLLDSHLLNLVTPVKLGTRRERKVKNNLSKTSS